MKVIDKITTEALMADKVRNALLSGQMKSPDGRKVRCDIALREFEFKGGKYDVVGYDKRENTMYIVECKLGDNLTSIGHAFGQILSYKSILAENGYEFLMKFYKKYSEDAKTKGYLKISLEDWMQILNKRKMNFRFFVAIKEQAKKLNKEVLMIKDNINFKVGILMVTRTGICTPQFWINKEIDKKLAESDKIEVPLVKKYTKRLDFLEAIEEKLKDMLPPEYQDFKSYKSKGYYKQFKLYPNTHYEIRFTSDKQVEIGLHIESNKEKTEKFFSFLLGKEKQIKSSLGTGVKIEKWGRGWTERKGAYWARVFELTPQKGLDENFLIEISERLKEYILTLQPILKESNNII